jgi:hypothetical protein
VNLPFLYLYNTITGFRVLAAATHPAALAPPAARAYRRPASEQEAPMFIVQINYGYRNATRAPVPGLAVAAE